MIIPVTTVNTTGLFESIAMSGLIVQLYLETMLRKTLITRLLIFVIVLVVLFGAALAVLVLLMVQRPVEYQPRLVAQDQIDAVNHYGNEKAAELYNHIELKQRFRIRFDQQGVNDLLMLADQQPQLSGRDLESRRIQMVQVSFSPGTIRVMGLVSYKGVQSVLTLCVGVRMTESGRLRLSLEPVKMGSLTIPNWFVLARFTQWLDSLGQDSFKVDAPFEPGKDKSDNHQWLKQTIESLKPFLSEFFQERHIILDSLIQDDLRLVDLVAADEILEITLIRWTRVKYPV